MLPWLAHGHISPFLELAKKLSTNTNISIYLCSTPVNLKSINLDSNSFPHIHLTELHLPSDHHDLPPHLQTTKNLPSHLMPLLKTAFDQSSSSFSSLLVSLSPHLLIYDFIQPWAPLAASRLHIPSILFLPIASSASSFFCHHLLRPPHNQFPFFEIPKKSDSIATITKVTNGLSDSDRFLQCINNSTEFVAVRTFREIESKYIDYLSLLIGKEVVPSEMVELAIGLERCGLCSIWVVRFEGGDSRRPTGFTWDRGLVIEGWAPQKSILAHPSVGGFVTHCGWSSVMEGMRQGVPMIAMPLQLDQPLNAELMVELGVAVKVEREEDGGFRGEEVARCIREVVVREEGEGVRRKAKEVARIMGCKEDEEIMVLKERIEGLVMAAENKNGTVQFN
ncbi:flavanone 7-O-glucoside 2''-O-beta-L-rhamnosyltransferase-like [Dendrobium catenatum]|uniref:flavanone 7-O-glucoside 2''-O-beta-L-rhamnosyltransferase-like n=1 Tax=Dendrobium catenatum TaxID=906689 RepID=UPI00109FE405|nr:flavanone 7-O-glucoside 2''-O-beta-L-rhamnosyltransferase-like [Dendrobium catenatum]